MFEAAKQVGQDEVWETIHHLVSTYIDVTAQLWSSSSGSNRKSSSRKAKQIPYKEGFYKSTMIIGEFKSESVQDAKPKVQEAMVKAMIKAGLAFPYAEPGGLIISRSADECVAALMDQRYLDMESISWRAQMCIF